MNIHTSGARRRNGDSAATRVSGSESVSGSGKIRWSAERGEDRGVVSGLKWPREVRSKL